MNQIQIETTFTEIIQIVLDGTEKQFNLRCPFTPDKIEVGMSMFVQRNAQNEDIIQPIYGSELVNANLTVYPQLFGSNIYYCNTTLPFQQSQPLVICNGLNTYNPLSSYMNNQRTSIQGTYSLNIFNCVDDSPVTNGGVILFFKFIRYENK